LLHKYKSWSVLDFVVCNLFHFIKLFTIEQKNNLIWWNFFLLLDLFLNVFYSVFPCEWKIKHFRRNNNSILNCDWRKELNDWFVFDSIFRDEFSFIKFLFVENKSHVLYRYFIPYGDLVHNIIDIAISFNCKNNFFRRMHSFIPNYDWLRLFSYKNDDWFVLDSKVSHKSKVLKLFSIEQKYDFLFLNTFFSKDYFLDVFNCEIPLERNVKGFRWIDSFILNYDWRKELDNWLVLDSKFPDECLFIDLFFIENKCLAFSRNIIDIIDLFFHVVKFIFSWQWNNNFFRRIYSLIPDNEFGCLFLNYKIAFFQGNWFILDKYDYCFVFNFVFCHLLFVIKLLKVA
jgi:hypothetical protein